MDAIFHCGYGKGPFCGNWNGRDDSFPFVQIFFGMALFVGSGSIGFLCLLRTPGLPGRNFGQTVFPDTLFLSVFYKSVPITLISVVFAAIVLVAHRENIKRILNGTESKITIGGKNKKNK